MANHLKNKKMDLKGIGTKTIEALWVLHTAGPTSPKAFARLMWPEQVEYREKHYVDGGLGALWRRAGSLLGKMARLNLVRRESDRWGFRRYRITKYGRHIMRIHPESDRIRNMLQGRNGERQPSVG